MNFTDLSGMLPNTNLNTNTLNLTTNTALDLNPTPRSIVNQPNLPSLPNLPNTNMNTNTFNTTPITSTDLNLNPFNLPSLNNQMQQKSKNSPNFCVLSLEKFFKFF